MRYENVCIESFGFSLPREAITSADLEARLEPLYERLRLPAGRLELMTGIRQRRVWPVGMLPSEQSIVSARHALAAADFDPSRIGALIHGSVCRDHLEPATASRVHCELGLSSDCFVYDVSNACLGVINGMLQVADMIELGQIDAGLVVGTEDSRHLIEATIDALNADTSLTRNSVKLAVASLTIGSGSCAVLLTHKRLSTSGTRLSASVARANTAFHRLCHSGRDEAVSGGMNPLMTTDSEALMREGIATGAATFRDFLTESDWSLEQLDKTCCHQVGEAHRKQMLASMDLDPDKDFATLQWLGNTGSVALPITTAIAAEQGHFKANDKVGLLGIGSGINCLMLAIDWQHVPVSSEPTRHASLGG
jgi:3-oxoacyl-[acyl-carrier-protein] synthase-3